MDGVIGGTATGSESLKQFVSMVYALRCMSSGLYHVLW